MLDVTNINEQTPSLLFYLPGLIFVSLILVVYHYYSFGFANKYSSNSKPNNHKVPRSYPLIGCSFAIIRNRNRLNQWASEILNNAPSSTFVLHLPLGLPPSITTSNPSNLQHILRTRFHVYQKGQSFRTPFFELFRDGLFVSDGKDWKLQRQLTSHQFNSKSFHDLALSTTELELSTRLYPVFSNAATNKTLLDLQEIFQRFTFDVVCLNLFGYDLQSLLPSLPNIKFADAFKSAIRIGTERYRASVIGLPSIWRVKRFLNIGSEKQFLIAVNEVHGFVTQLIRKRKQELLINDGLFSRDSRDMMSGLLSCGCTDEKFLEDILISLFLAGQESILAALIWFFWLICKNPDAETEIVKEIRETDDYHNMPYTRASLCECMRLYPPVPANTKEAMADDVWPDGTKIKKGMKIVYHIYALGRSKEMWGPDCEEFRPERWLERDSTGGEKWRFVARDPYTYPVFQAGPRMCLGVEISFMQMSRVVAGVLRRFRIVSAVDGFEPEYISYLTSKMKDGFPVRLQEREVH